MKVSKSLIVILLCLITIPLFAVPKILTLKTILKNDKGEYLNSFYDVTVRFYKVDSQDKLIKVFEELHPSVKIEGGFFKIYAGSINTISKDIILGDIDKYSFTLKGAGVDNEEVFFKVTPDFFALRSNYADLATEVNWETATKPQVSTLPGKITSEQLPPTIDGKIIVGLDLDQEKIKATVDEAVKTKGFLTSVSSEDIPATISKNLTLNNNKDTSSLTVSNLSDNNNTKSGLYLNADKERAKAKIELKKGDDGVNRLYLGTETNNHLTLVRNNQPVVEYNGKAVHQIPVVAPGFEGDGSKLTSIQAQAITGVLDQKNIPVLTTEKIPTAMATDAEVRALVSGEFRGIIPNETIGNRHINPQDPISLKNTTSTLNADALPTELRKSYFGMAGNFMNGIVRYFIKNESTNNETGTALTLQADKGGYQGELKLHKDLQGKKSFDISSSEATEINLIKNNEAKIQITNQDRVIINDPLIAQNGISGNGAAITNLNASQLTTGTIAAARLPENWLEDKHIKQISGSKITGTLAGELQPGSVGLTHLAGNMIIPFSKLEISKADITGLGIPAIDTKLTETEVDAMVANNGYLNAIPSIKNSDMIFYQEGYKRFPIGTNGQILSVVDGYPTWTDLQKASYTAGAGLSLSGSTFSVTNLNESFFAANTRLPFSILNITKEDITGLGIIDTNTQLTETQVDNFVANNGYILTNDARLTDARTPYISSQTNGDIIIYQNGWKRLAAGSDGKVLKVSSGYPAWSDDNNSGGDITTVTAGAGLSGGGTSGDVGINHSDTSSQVSINNSGAAVIQDGFVA